MTTRRDLVLSLGAAAAAAALPRSLVAQPARALGGVGVQLYTLRQEMRADPERTLARIAEIGYQEIEWWGSWGRTPAQLRALLDQHRLTSPSWHLDPRQLEPDQLRATLETAQTMGHKHLIVAWISPNERSAEKYRSVAARLNDAGRAGRALGIKAGYHNHDFEFTVKVGDESLWQFLLRETDPSVVDIELDCYWAFRAGHDPIALLRTHRDRITHLHIKDSGPAPEYQMRDVGAGIIDWRAVITTGAANRVQHAFVEHDSPADAWATVSAGRRHLRTLGY